MKHSCAAALALVALLMCCWAGGTAGLDDCPVNWNDTSVTDAYKSCILGGIQFVVKPGVDGTSFGADVKWTPSPSDTGSPVMLTHLKMSPAKSASCTVSGLNGTGNNQIYRANLFNSGALDVSLIANAVYSIVCDATGTFSRPTDIYISTTKGTYRTRINRAASSNTITSLTNRLKMLEDRLATSMVTCASGTCSLPAGNNILDLGSVKLYIENGNLDFYGNMPGPQFGGKATRTMRIGRDGNVFIDHPTIKNLLTEILKSLVRSETLNNYVRLGENIFLIAKESGHGYLQAGPGYVMMSQSVGPWEHWAAVRAW